MNGVTSKSLTSAAILTGCLVASNVRMGPTPLLPLRHADQKSYLPTPFGATTPMPLMTTLRIPAYLTRTAPPRLSVVSGRKFRRSCGLGRRSSFFRGLHFLGALHLSFLFCLDDTNLQ